MTAVLSNSLDEAVFFYRSREEELSEDRVAAPNCETGFATGW